MILIDLNFLTKRLHSPQTLAFLFLAVVYVLLVNLLIAMMGDTYTRIAEIKNEWMRQVDPRYQLVNFGYGHDAIISREQGYVLHFGSRD